MEGYGGILAGPHSRIAQLQADVRASVALADARVGALRAALAAVDAGDAGAAAPPPRAEKEEERPPPEGEELPHAAALQAAAAAADDETAALVAAVLAAAAASERLAADAAAAERRAAELSSLLAEADRALLRHPRRMELLEALHRTAEERAAVDDAILCYAVAASSEQDLPLTEATLRRRLGADLSGLRRVAAADNEASVEAASLAVAALLAGAAAGPQTAALQHDLRAAGVLAALAGGLARFTDISLEPAFRAVVAMVEGNTWSELVARGAGAAKALASCSASSPAARQLSSSLQKPLPALRGHGGPVTCVAFGPAGAVASSSWCVVGLG